MREAGKRYLKMRHYDVQMVGGYILHKGMIAEMVTGEGKTLVATLPAFLNGVWPATCSRHRQRLPRPPRHGMDGAGLHGAGPHRRRDSIAAWTPRERQNAYACDITYGTNNEFGFDYLRDNMKPTRELQVQGPLDYAIVDEIDNILIDEARTPLIISGPASRRRHEISRGATASPGSSRRDVDFEVKEKEHTCHLTDEGVTHAEELAGVESFYTAGNMEWPHLIDNALKAHSPLQAGRELRRRRATARSIIVDEHTGRKMDGRQWSDGLHQAVEAKEGVKIKEETQTLATDHAAELLQALQEAAPA